MRRSLSILFGLLLLATTAQAQETPPRGLAHVFFSPGRAISDGGATVLHFGGGGEGRIYKGLGAGAEIGYLFPAKSGGDGFGVLSTNGFYHFWSARSSSNLVPFVTAGYSLAFRNGTANLANFGGGVDYWFRDRMALRLEVRDHLWPGDTNTHFLMFRVGLVGR